MGCICGDLRAQSRGAASGTRFTAAVQSRTWHAGVESRRTSMRAAWTPRARRRMDRRRSSLELARIDSITDAAGLLAEIARLHRMGAGPGFFAFAAPDAKHSNDEIANLAQGGLGLPERDYYFRARHGRRAYAASVRGSHWADTRAHRRSRGHGRSRGAADHGARDRAGEGVDDDRRAAGSQRGLSQDDCRPTRGDHPRLVMGGVFPRHHGRPGITTINVHQPEVFHRVRPPGPDDADRRLEELSPVAVRRRGRHRF